MKLDVDPLRAAGKIQPLWFSHNLEHTRSCIYKGLSAQMLANRKFAGKPAPTGVAMEWEAVGPIETLFIHDNVLMEGRGAFTRHYDPKDRRRDNEVRIQRVISVNAEPAGIAQGGICLRKGRSYELGAALLAGPDACVTLQLVSGDGKTVHFTMGVEVGFDWQQPKLAFTAKADDDNARLEILVHGPVDLWVGMASLLPADHFHGMRRDVIELLAEIGTPMLRWPGGNFAGDYRWQDGLVPVDERSPLGAFTEIETLPHSGGFDNHEIGTDEFVALCRQVGAEPFMTFNASWESPQMCADWLQYCNGSPDSRWGKVRAERGHRQPYNVKFWSLGNEMGYGHMEGPNTPAGYAAKAKEMVDALRAVDPGVTLVASGFYERPEWFTEGLANMASHVDMIAIHWYTLLQNTYAKAADDAEFDRVARADVKVAGELQRVRRQMEEASGGKRIGISFDEWNIWYNWYAIPRVVDALYACSMLNMFCREFGSLGVDIGCYFEPINEGAIRVEPDRAWLTTVGQVMRLHKAHVGNTLIELPGFKSGEDVDVAASVSGDGARIVVTAVNRHRRDERAVELSIPGGKSLAGAAGVMLHAPRETAVHMDESPLPISTTGSVVSFTLPRQSVAKLDISLWSPQESM